ncbi:SpvB/TcaC N-terminal domain-containing protein [Streptomyces sp. HPF1205]|uniref:SpvB/TcaC N-terminal domain-containing protein n=1 Tax=Streptomyces sp. HPF1205 TaxID=2873262 RepID=UPI001CEC2069|nr:SpvB/TcaC N-terminal domain-containing protein [Streptomyces sp. HPF1205]
MRTSPTGGRGPRTRSRRRTRFTAPAVALLLMIALLSAAPAAEVFPVPSAAGGDAVAVPEHPDVASFDANQLSGIASADPGAGIDLIEPPRADNQGDNRLSYPIEVPPGRQGLQPDLSVGYDSGGGDGWMGVGWDLAVPVVTVDTRWGVPRYDARTETETYLLNGEQLTPLAHRGPPRQRAGEKVFHTRTEGDFARIVRHGSGPAGYTWEVTDKSGTHWFYGAPAGGQGPQADATLTDGSGNVFEWALTEVRDAHDNVMRYQYARVEDPGVDGGAEPGSNLYLSRITYTCTDTCTGTGEGRYSVTFTRDRELGEPLRADKTIDARGGFKRVTADRLRRIDVALDGKPIRSYEFTYTTGAFDKTLLESISQYDADGSLFNRHRFDYYDDIRDAHGGYQAFKQVPWTSPPDGLSQGPLDLPPDHVGRAGALNANTSAGGGGHLYVGIGAEPSKSGSVGDKLGFGYAQDNGLLALVDVDGDGLPDKVFRHGDTIEYRKNLSGPNGQAAFSAETKTLDLPGFTREHALSFTVGVEGYPGAIAAQLDDVNTFSVTDRYFSDVNGDGITDLVDGTSVLFGRIGADGRPVYGLSSQGTPVPVGGGSVDASGFPGFDEQRQRLAHSNALLDTVRRWVAPYSGTVRIDGAVRLAPETAGARAASQTADGVRVAIQHEGTELWADRITARDDSEHTPTGVDRITVARGERLYFRVQSVSDGSLDQVDWDPRIAYLDVADQDDVNGLPVYRYQASRDFTLGGRDARITAPYTGVMHLSGDVTKSGATSDDVTALITRDGTPVLEHTLTGATTGTVPVALDIDVRKGQTLQWRIAADSPVDLSRIGWTPRAVYTSAEGVDRVTDGDGNPLIVLDPPYSVDMYPVDGLTAPQGFHHVDTDGPMTVTPRLSVGPGAPDARVAFTVKRRGELIAKRYFTVHGERVDAPPPFTVDARAGDDLFFDFSTRAPGLRGHLTGQSVTVTTGSGDHTVTVTVPSAFHSPAQEGAFPQPYRGWGAVGYNGNEDRATAPIRQGDLVIDSSYRDQLPRSVDPQADKDAFEANPRIDPPKVIPFVPDPQHRRWSSGQDSWASAGGASSSRLGSGTISVPEPSQWAGGIAVPRLAYSNQLSLTGSVGSGTTLGGSISTGGSAGLIDFLDMNGDQFPDVVSPGGIQYSSPVGGLGDTHSRLPDAAARTNWNVAGNVSAGSAARTLSTGRGDAAPTGRRTANTAESGNELPPLGVGGDLGANTSDATTDLLDINGDGLPDRVYDDGNVALNLGYRFGAKEPWRNPAPLNAGKGTSWGVNLGFQTDFYGFAGGASYSQNTASATATLQDVNGDGLPDRVFAGDHGGPMEVAVNTGSGFDPAVPFTGSLPQINRDQNAQLSGGAYATIPICVLPGLCVVINPGANASTGVGRTQQMLADINGDGNVDQLESTADDQLTARLNTTGRTNLLRSVTRPLGGTLDFDYTRDGNTYQQPHSRWDLTSVAVDDGHRGDGQDIQLTTYEYHDGVFDRLEREFDGYGQVIERRRNHGNGDTVYRSVIRDYRTDGHYTRGLMTRERTVDAGDHPYLETDHTYALRDINAPDSAADPASTTATIFPHLVRTDSHFYEGAPTPAKSTYTTMEYDDAGNVTRSFDAGDSGPADDTDTRTRYSADDPACQATHITGIPTAVDVYGSTTLMRHRQATVDCGNGDVTRIRADLADGAGAVTDLAYFPDGNLSTVIDPPNRRGQRYRLDYTYDPDVHTHVADVTDSFGLHSHTTTDLRFGLPGTVTDINGQVTRTTYDAAGRPATVTGPYETSTGHVTIAFDYHPDAPVPYAVSHNIDRQADDTVRDDTLDTITFTDGLDRPIQTKKDAALHTGPDTAPADAMTVSGHVDYDFLGRPVRQYHPVSEPKSPANTTFNPTIDTVTPTVLTYDVLDRTTRTDLPDATHTESAYAFGPDRDGNTEFQTTDTDANGHPARTYQDVRRRTAAVEEFNPVAGQPVIWTSYAYDPLGRLTAVTDDHHHTTTATYDNLGRRTTLDNPDTGPTRTAYDLAGNPVRTITANLAAAGRSIDYDYDYNRLTDVRYPVFEANDVHYTYGPPGAPNNAAGRVTAQTDGAGTLTRGYGPLGEVTRETRTVTTQGHQTRSFTTRYRYDTWNRLLDLTYPDGETLAYHYNSGGQVDQATGTKADHTYRYLTRLDYDKFEQPVLLDTGNGTRTTYTYDPANLRLANLTARLAQGYVFQNLNYRYDHVGDITALRNDTTPPTDPDAGFPVGGPTSETFQYDDLDQLTHAEGTYQPRTPPHTDTYRLDLRYDTTGNITDKTQVHQLVTGGTTTTDRKLTYTSPYTYTTAHPHAPTTVGDQTLTYDANGNQISRDQQPGPRRQLIWDENNRLECTHENVQRPTLPQAPQSCDNAGGTPNAARYRYDDQGNRVVKDAAQFHVHPNQYYATDGNQSFKNIYIGDTRLLTKTVEPPQRTEDRQYYTHGDHLDSTQFVTDAHGRLTEHVQYLPAGETWVEEHPSQPIPYQYTGKELDPETGLYYYGARYYDPRHQLWQNPDPALTTYLDGTPESGAYDPLNLALYTYAGNNPVLLTDPSGLGRKRKREPAEPAVEESVAAPAEAEPAAAPAVDLESPDLLLEIAKQRGQEMWTERQVMLAELAARVSAGELTFEQYAVEKKRNIAVALLSLGGEVYGFESISGGRDAEGMVPALTQETSAYETMTIEEIDRIHDTEHKLLEAIGNFLRYSGTQADQIQGRIGLYTWNPVCASCGHVIRQFMQEFPGVSVSTLSLNGGEMTTSWVHSVASTQSSS